AAPMAGNGYEEHCRIELRAIAAACGLTYEQFTGDYSQVNFTSGRLAKMEFKRIVEQEQWLIFIPLFLNCVADRFVSVAYVAGLTRKAACARDWTAPRIEMTDPLKEVKALIALIDAGLISRQEGQRQLGYDVETMNDEIATDPPPKTRTATRRTPATNT
ncbi:phage portal protein, partial [Chitinasiproducens palmae]